MKKGNIFLRFALTCTILLIAWTAISAKLVYLSFQDAEDIYDLEFDITEHGKGGHIKSQLYISLGSCASETTTTKKHGATVSSSTDYYYVVPAFDKNDEVYFICVLVDSKDIPAYKAITYYENPDPVNFEGTINELDDEVYKYMYDSTKEWNDEAMLYDSDAELKKHVLPLCLQSMKFDSAPLFIGIFFVLLALTILMWVLFFRRRSKIKAEASEFVVPVHNNSTNDLYDTQGMIDNYSSSIIIGGISYPKASFDQINAYVNSNEQIKAIKELRDMTGLGLAEAKNIIDNWSSYYN